jgi:hypothetical protein
MSGPNHANKKELRLDMKDGFGALLLLSIWSGKRLCLLLVTSLARAGDYSTNIV